VLGYDLDDDRIMIRPHIRRPLGNYQLEGEPMVNRREGLKSRFMKKLEKFKKKK
jgi:hypothetical protein